MTLSQHLEKILTSTGWYLHHYLQWINQKLTIQSCVTIDSWRFHLFFQLCNLYVWPGYHRRPRCKAIQVRLINKKPTYVFMRLFKLTNSSGRFSPSQDGTIKGGHSDPKNVDYWRAGCLGITGGCGVKCQTAFIDCVENSDVSSADARTKSWMECMEESR